MILACGSCDPPVVHIDAARLYEPPGLALRRRETDPRDQIDVRRCRPNSIQSPEGHSTEHHPKIESDILHINQSDRLSKQEPRRFRADAIRLFLTMNDALRQFVREDSLSIPSVLVIAASLRSSDGALSLKYLI